MFRSVRAALLSLAVLLAGCTPSASDLTFSGGMVIEFGVMPPDVRTIESSKGPDGGTFEVVRGNTKLIAVMQGPAMGFPLVPGGVVREQAENPVAVNLVDGRIKEYRFRHRAQGSPDIYVQVLILPASGPDRALAERIAKSIRVE